MQSGPVHLGSGVFDLKETSRKQLAIAVLVVLVGAGLAGQAFANTITYGPYAVLVDPAPAAPGGPPSGPPDAHDRVQNNGSHARRWIMVDGKY